MRTRTKAAVAAAVAAGALTLGTPLAAYASSLHDESSSGAGVERSESGTTGNGPLTERSGTYAVNERLPASTSWH